MTNKIDKILCLRALPHPPSSGAPSRREPYGVSVIWKHNTVLRLFKKGEATRASPFCLLYLVSELVVVYRYGLAV